MSQDGKLIFTKVNMRRCAALLQNNTLVAASFQGEKEKVTGGVYVARVRDIVPSLNACFAEVKQGMVCFLPDLNAQTPLFLPHKSNTNANGGARKIKQGDLILVQGIREAQKTKQATVTTKISLANRFFVITLGASYTGFSSKLSTQEKNQLRQEICSPMYFDEKGCLRNWTWISEDQYPYKSLFPSAGIIFRTECREVPFEVLRGAFMGLLNEFTNLLHEACYRSVYSCLRTPPSPWEDAVNHFVLPQEYQEIVTDDPELYAEMKDSPLIPEGKTVRLYYDPSYALEKLYSLASKLEAALSTRVWLKSGAYLVIEPTEALTVIDVNSGKFEARKDKENYYKEINLEAAKEIAHQIRLRNLSGMILVDFINMTSQEDQALLISEMESYLQNDRVKSCVVDFTKLGLMEITRMKTVPPLLEQAYKYHYPLPKG